MGMVNSNRERKRVLFVEDYEDAWDMVGYQLEEHTLFYARGFDEGLRLARLGYFDIYILDNWLPDGSGIELCRLIREFDPHTPILFYSAAAHAKDIQEAICAGAQNYLTKPVRGDELQRAVGRLTAAADRRNFEARRAERAAILEEMAVRQAELREKSEKIRSRSVKATARAAFLDAGGTRGAFAREWLSMSVEQVCGAPTPAAMSND